MLKRDAADCGTETEAKQEIQNNSTELSNKLIVAALRYEPKYH